MRIPGVLHRQVLPGLAATQEIMGLYAKRLPLEEWTSYLDRRDPEGFEAAREPITVGTWVQIRSGQYQGDIGYVMIVDAPTEQPIVVRLVPRYSRVPTAERKRGATHRSVREEPSVAGGLGTTNYLPALLTTQAVANLGGPVAQKHSELFSGMYNKLVFDHGLILLNYHQRSLTTTDIAIPTAIAALFLESDTSNTFKYHDHLPRCSEWSFQEGENVLVKATGETATVSAVRHDMLEVDVSTLGMENRRLVRWSDVLKFVKLGDYVEVLNGQSQGATGWVVNVHPDNEHVEILEPTDIDVLAILLEKSVDKEVEMSTADSRAIGQLDWFKVRSQGATFLSELRFD